MPRDYRETVRALRAKADDPVVPEPERKALRAKADEIEAKHLPRNSNVTAGQATITDRSGQTGDFNWDEWRRQWEEFAEQARRQQQQERFADAMRQTEDLFRRQHTWNKPPDPDPDDLISHEYKTNTAHSFHTTDDEDYGYDEWISGGYDNAE